MKNYKVILIALLCGITIFSVFRYILSFKEKQDLMNTLNQTRGQITTLENEKQNLLQDLEKEKELQQKLAQENSTLKDNLRASKNRLDKLFGDFQEAKQAVEQLDFQISLLVSENTTLKEEEERLNTQLTRVVQERDNLKARLTSLAELKKAIRALKKRVRKVGAEIKERVKPHRVIEGNQGFLIKNGLPTYPAKVKIEVMPAPKSE